MFPSHFRTEPFTQEELIRFTTALSKGRVQDVVSLVSELTPEKELEIQKLVNHFSPVFKGYEQKVKGFLDHLQTQESLQITEPQQEEKLNRLIRKELDSVKTRNRLETAISELNSLKADSAEKTADIQETIKEHKKALKGLEADVAESITLDNVRNILKAATVTQERVVAPPSVPEGLPVEDKPVKEETKTEKLPEETPKVEEPKLDELTKSEKPVEEVTKDKKLDEVKTDEAPAPELLPSDVEVKVEEPEPVVLGAGSKVKECCGSKGHRHKKNCSTKQ